MPTEADWGRLYLFNSTGDAGLIMPFRSYYFRDFFAGGWTDMAIGLFHSTMGNGGGDTADLVAERQAESVDVNLFHFGLSKSSGSTIQVQNNPNFLGLRGILGGVTQINTSPTTLAQLQLTMIKGNNGGPSGSPITMPLSAGISSTPFSAIGIRFIYDPTTKIIHLNWDKIDSLALPDDSTNVSAMQSFLSGIDNSTTSSDAQFQTDGDLSNFSSYYIYWPYLTNRLKLQCVGATKFG